MSVCVADMSDSLTISNGCAVGYKHGRYTPLHQLGKGTYGRVLCCRDEHTGERVAVKVTHNDAAYRCSAVNEIRTLHRLSSHPDVVRIRDSFEEQGHICIVTELLQQNLYEALRARAFAPMHVRDVGKIALHILRAVAALHRTGYMHCDIKPENVMLRCAPPPAVSSSAAPVLLSSPLHLQAPLQLLHLGTQNGGGGGGAAAYNAYYGSGAAATVAGAHHDGSAVSRTAFDAGQGARGEGSGSSGLRRSGNDSSATTDYDRACLIDFGAVRALHENTYYDVQSLWYRAPEVLCKVPYTPRMDAWSIGCVLYELYTGKALFPGQNAQDQLARIVQLVGSPSPATLCESSSIDIATHAAKLTVALGRQQQQQHQHQLLSLPQQQTQPPMQRYGDDGARVTHTTHPPTAADAASAAAIATPATSRAAIVANVRNHIRAQRTRLLQQQQQRQAAAAAAAAVSLHVASSVGAADGTYGDDEAAHVVPSDGAGAAYVHSACENVRCGCGSDAGSGAAAMCGADTQAEDELCDLIVALLHPDHHLRLGCDEALHHPFFATLQQICAQDGAPSVLGALPAAATAVSATHEQACPYGDDYSARASCGYGKADYSNDGHYTQTTAAALSGGSSAVVTHAPPGYTCRVTSSPRQQQQQQQQQAMTHIPVLSTQTGAHYTHTVAAAATTTAHAHNALCSPVALNTLPHLPTFAPPLQQQQQQQQQQLVSLGGVLALSPSQCYHYTAVATTSDGDDERADATAQPTMRYVHTGTAHGDGGGGSSSSSSSSSGVGSSGNVVVGCGGDVRCGSGHNVLTSATMMMSGDSPMFVHVDAAQPMVYHVPFSFTPVGVQSVYAVDAHMAAGHGVHGSTANAAHNANVAAAGFVPAVCAISSVPSGNNNNSNNNTHNTNSCNYALPRMYSVYSQDNMSICSSSNSMLDMLNNNNNNNNSISLHDSTDCLQLFYSNNNSNNNNNGYSGSNYSSNNNSIDGRLCVGDEASAYHAAATAAPQAATAPTTLHYVTCPAGIQLAQPQLQLPPHNSCHFVQSSATALYAHPAYNTAAACYSGVSERGVLHCAVAPIFTHHAPLAMQNS